MNPEPAGTVNGAWMPTLVFDSELKISRESLQAAFASANVDARVFFWPLTSLPMFEEQRQNTQSWEIPTRSINLPSYHDMTKNEQDRVIEVVNSEVNENH
jgi:perosamine synthetase